MTSTKGSQFIVTEAEKPIANLLLAHGAGAPMDSDWMNDLCQALADQQICTVRFEFPYMQERRLNGKKRPPDRAPKLIEHWKKVIDEAGQKEALFIAGKSMGGRIASLIADEVEAQGLVVLGFPFHGPGRPLGDRHLHLTTIQTPTLILQGSRDTMGDFDTISPLKFPKNLKVSWFEDGDHSLKPRKSSEFTLKQHMQNAAAQVKRFLEARL